MKIHKKKILIIGIYYYLSAPILDNFLANKYLKSNMDIDLLIPMRFYNEDYSRFLEMWHQSFNSISVENINHHRFSIVRELLTKSRLNSLGKKTYDYVISFSDLLILYQLSLKIFDSKFVLIQPSHFPVKKSEKHRSFVTLMIDLLYLAIFRVPNRKMFWGKTNNTQHLMLWGDEFKLFFPFSENIHIVGNLTYPDYKLITEGNDYILLFDNAFIEPVLKLRELYLHLLEDYDNYKFVIKIHPRIDQVSEIHNYFDRLDNLTIIHNEVSSNELIKKSILTISRNSKTAYDSVILGKQTILVFPDQMTESKFNHPVFKSADDLSDLKLFINNSNYSLVEFYSLREDYMRKNLNYPNNSIEQFIKKIETLY